MDVRKKLVELLYTPFLQYKIKELSDTGDIANYLISHGVTVQEWISVKDRLPEHGDVVLCFMKFGEQRILQWDNVSKWWLGYGHGDDWQKADVAYWCCLPQPPKGDLK